MSSDEAGLTVAVERDRAGTVVSVGGELEFATAAALRNVLLDLARQGTGAVAVDLAAVEFIDSTGISLLVQAKQRFESQGARFSLRDPAPRVVRVLEVAGLVDLFAIDGTPR